MGWTSYHATFYKNGTVDRKAECDAIYNWQSEKAKARVLKSSVVGSIYYAAVEVTTFATEEKEEKTKVCCAVTRTAVDRKDYFNFSYKDMDETMHPCYYDCPKGILDLLSPTTDKDALEWRKRCEEKRAKKKDPHSLKNLPVGSIIEFTTNFDLKSGRKKGEKIKVYKAKKPNGRTYWSDGYYRYPPELIGDDYSVLKEKS